MRPIFYLCLALISVSHAVFRMEKCSSTLELSEYDRSQEDGRNVRGFYEHHSAASPYYFANFAQVGTDVPAVSFSISPGSDYLSRNQIPTSDDFKRINPTAFLETNNIMRDTTSEKASGGPFLTTVDFGDGKTRYISAYATIQEAAGRFSLNWARQVEWQTENACEYFSGSYYKVECGSLWSFSNGTYIIKTNEIWETGFGSGNPLVGDTKTQSGLSAQWSSDLGKTSPVEVNIYYNLGMNDKIGIFDGQDITTSARLADITGPAKGVMTVQTTAYDFSANYSTASNNGHGFRAVYNTIGEYPCFSTGGPNQCDDACYKAYICSWDGVSMSASLLQNFDYTTCCTSNWGPECVLAADSVYWLQVCDENRPDLPYSMGNHNRDVERESFLASRMPHVDSVSQLHQQTIRFPGMKSAKVGSA